ncbi:MAG: RCC1 domain-containing protein [Gemmatimonadales bacterium]
MSLRHRSYPGRWYQLSATALPLAVFLSLFGCADPTASSDGGTAPGLSLLAATMPSSFRQVSVGMGHICGVTPTNLAYCWGSNDQGQLGIGSTSSLPQRSPQAVTGGLRFKQVSAGFQHTCGVTTQNRVYCWGWNFDGEVGDGTGYPINIRRLTPVPVGGVRRFTQVRAGHHTCAIEAGTNAAFCWGYNVFGQLGDDSRNTQWRPTRVKGALHFRQISIGVDHTCGVTTTNVGYCWGQNFWGTYGNGSTVGESHPVRAGGLLRYTMLQAGRYHTCGLTTTGRAHCWGHNSRGQLGDGSFDDHIVPRPVSGGLTFDHLSGPDEHVCGVTSENLAYCWGDNSAGAIGDGTIRVDRPTPTAVTGGLRFSGVWAGLFQTCGVTPEQRAYCWGSGAYSPSPTPIGDSS